MREGERNEVTCLSLGRPLQARQGARRSNGVVIRSLGRYQPLIHASKHANKQREGGRGAQILLTAEHISEGKGRR